MDNRPRSGIKQKDARIKKFPHDQYWFVSYSECYKRGDERDFKTIIKARSAELAKKILILRLQEDSGFLKIRTVTISLVHEYWQIATLRKKLSITQWESVRNISFPNEWNKLFKLEKKRIDGQFNRFSVPHTQLSKEHKAKLRKAANKLVDDFVRDTFKPMCPQLRIECLKPSYVKTYGQRLGFASLKNPCHAAQELAHLKKLMEDCGGNIKYASEKADVARSSFRRALNRFPEVNWRKEFPLTYTREPEMNSMDRPGAREKLSQTLKAIGHRPPPNRKGTKQYNKWKATITATWKRKKKTLYTEWKANLIVVLRKHDHKRKESAEELGVTVGGMVRRMAAISKKDSKFKKEFMSPELSLRLKQASCRRTRELKRLNYLKENKHIILQAYYQNGETDYKAAKVLKVDIRTFTRWREEIEKYEM